MVGRESKRWLRELKVWTKILLKILNPEVQVDLTNEERIGMVAPKRVQSKTLRVKEVE